MDTNGSYKVLGFEYASHGGTFAGNTITLTAGLATIDVLEQSPVYTHIDTLGNKVRERLNTIFEENEFEAQTTGIGSLFCIHTTRTKPLKDAGNARPSLIMICPRRFSVTCWRMAY